MLGVTHAPPRSTLGCPPLAIPSSWQAASAVGRWGRPGHALPPRLGGQGQAGLEGGGALVHLKADEDSDAGTQRPKGFYSEPQGGRPGRAQGVPRRSGGCCRAGWRVGCSRALEGCSPSTPLCCLPCRAPSTVLTVLKTPGTACQKPASANAWVGKGRPGPTTAAQFFPGLCLRGRRRAQQKLRCSLKPGHLCSPEPRPWLLGVKAGVSAQGTLG